MPEIQFDIVSYRSAGPIQFGFTLEQLNVALGASDDTMKNSEGEPNYYYGALNVIFSPTSNTVVEVVFGPEATVRLDDIDIFNDASALEKLIGRDGEPFEYYGFLVLLKLGIALTGFHDEDDQKAVTAFAKGRWDHLRSKLNPFTLSVDRV